MEGGEKQVNAKTKKRMSNQASVLLAWLTDATGCFLLALAF